VISTSVSPEPSSSRLPTSRLSTSGRPGSDAARRCSISAVFGQYDERGWLGGTAPDPFASTVSIYLAVTDPDAHHVRAVGAGAQIVRPLVDQDYGSREYSARDLEGNLWSFGTYNPAAGA